MTERKLRKKLLASVPFETERLIIRYIVPDDAYDMFEYSCKPSITKYLLWHPHANIAATEGYIESLQKRYLRGMYSDWAIVLKSTGKMIGTIGYANIISSEKSCEIGYVLSEDYQHFGYMTEAMEAMLDLTFKSLNFQKAVLRIISENLPSIKLAERFNFHPDYRIDMLIKDVEREVVHYQLFQNEYKK